MTKLTYTRNPFAGLDVTILSETPTELVLDTHESADLLDARLAGSGWTRVGGKKVVIQHIESEDMAPPPSAEEIANRKAAVEAARAANLKK